jgi:hypothetical protein
LVIRFSLILPRLPSSIIFSKICWAPLSQHLTSSTLPPRLLRPPWTLPRLPP